MKLSRRTIDCSWVYEEMRMFSPKSDRQWIKNLGRLETGTPGSPELRNSYGLTSSSAEDTSVSQLTLVNGGCNCVSLLFDIGSYSNMAIVV